MLTFAVRLMCEVLEMQRKRLVKLLPSKEKAGYSQRQLAKIANISNAELSKNRIR